MGFSADGAKFLFRHSSVNLQISEASVKNCRVTLRLVGKRAENKTPPNGGVLFSSGKRSDQTELLQFDPEF